MKNSEIRQKLIRKGYVILRSKLIGTKWAVCNYNDKGGWQMFVTQAFESQVAANNYIDQMIRETPGNAYLDDRKIGDHGNSNQTQRIYI